jgi:hypothetical protein
MWSLKMSLIYRSRSGIAVQLLLAWHFTTTQLLGAMGGCLQQKVQADRHELACSQSIGVLCCFRSPTMSSSC